MLSGAAVTERCQRYREGFMTQPDSNVGGVYLLSIQNDEFCSADVTAHEDGTLLKEADGLIGSIWSLWWGSDIAVSHPWDTSPSGGLMSVRNLIDP